MRQARTRRTGLGWFVAALAAGCACAAELCPLPDRPNPLWFWNNATVEESTLLAQMKLFQDAGYGGLSILPFGGAFRPTYLSEEYFSRYRACAAAAQKMGLTLWLYDEYGFPSGSAGLVNGDGKSRFAAAYPNDVLHRLDKREVVVKGDATTDLAVGTDPLMAAVAMETTTLQRVNVRDAVKDGHLRWTAPAGTWRVMAFTLARDMGIVDYLSYASCQKFVQLTHEAYYAHLKEYFGKVIVGTFFDEPTLYRCQGRAWTPSFNTQFTAAHGFSPELLYPALWYDIGPETVEARNLLFGFRAELYATGFPKAVNDWSVVHGIHATGHQDNEEVVNPVGTSADLMKCFKCLEMPGIDKIGGNRPAELFYKVVSSAAHNWDHGLVMSETYGAMGDLDWREIYSIAMDQYTKGVNVLIPHAVWYDVNRVTFKPELSPRHPKYAQELPRFTAFLTRLNAALRAGRTVCDVAVLYPIASAQAGHRFDGPLSPYQGGVAVPELDYPEVSRVLTDELGVDFEYLHPEVVERVCRVENGRLVLPNASQKGAFHTFIIPSGSVVSRGVMEKAQALAAAGGRIVFTGTLPERGTRKVDDAFVTETVRALLAQGARHVRTDAASLAQAIGRAERPFDVSFVGGASMGVRTIHRTANGRNTWYFANPTDHLVQVRVSLAGDRHGLTALDPHVGSEASIVASEANGRTEFMLELGPTRSLIVHD